MTSPAATALAASLIVALGSGCASMQVYAPEPGDPPGAVEPAHPTVTTVFLVGDGGKLKPGDRLLALLQTEVEAAVGDLGAANVATVLLGDNLYPRGLPIGSGLDSAHGQALRLQLEAARASRIWAVLGNHDWNHSRRGGRARALHQIEQVERWAEENGVDAAVVPGRKCPLPVAGDVGTTVRLIFLDTQWWLHPRDTSAGYCPGNGRDAGAIARVSAEMVALMSSAGDRLTLVAAHHPLQSGGPHGSRFSPRQHLFPLTDIHPAIAVPLPGLGSVVQALRPYFTSQDIRSIRYRRLRRWTDSVLAGREILAWAAGHEHGLQVLAGDGAIRFHLVSGAATPEKRSPIAPLERTLLAAPRNGYLRLDVDARGGVRVTMTFLEDGCSPRRVSRTLRDP